MYVCVHVCSNFNFYGAPLNFFMEVRIVICAKSSAKAITCQKKMIFYIHFYINFIKIILKNFVLNQIL